MTSNNAQELKDERERALARGEGEGLKHNMLVEAAAGTGKTTLLVSRVVNIFRQGDPASPAAKRQPFGPERLVAITFTETAAAEMKARVRDKLEDEIKSSSGAETELLQGAYDRLERAQILTIHSFAFSLIKERPIEAEISPVAEVLEGVSRQEMSDSCWERWLIQNLSAPKDDALEIAFAAGLTLERLRETAYLLMEKRDLIEDSYLESTPNPYDEFRKLRQSFENDDRWVRAVYTGDGSDRQYLAYSVIREFILGAPDDTQGLLIHLSKTRAGKPNEEF